ncbi:hypothetical protein ACOSP7_007044 [Xanthoceras sorbifolium]
MTLNAGRATTVDKKGKLKQRASRPQVAMACSRWKRRKKKKKKEEEEEEEEEGKREKET